VENQLLDVYIQSEKVYGNVKHRGAFASMVIYQKDGVHYEELLENEDLIFMDSNE
jgi:ribulose-5-phosphate 4-epimerase/fuculose-1-phosphate aldolase